MNKVLGFIPSELIELFFHYFFPLNRVRALYHTSINLRFFNIKLGRAHQLVLISGICQIDLGCQNF